MAEAAAVATPAGARIDRPADLDRVVRRLVDELHPVAIYLFGSRARGDAGADSDYDLMVVVPDDGPGGEGRRRRSVEYSRIGRIDANVFLSRESAFAWRRREVGTLAYEAATDGVRLYPVARGGEDPIPVPLEGLGRRHPKPPPPAGAGPSSPGEAGGGPGWGPPRGSANRSAGLGISIPNPKAAGARRPEVVREWLARVAKHLKVARLCCEGDDAVPDQGAYHVQQAAEKLTKAALVAHGIRPRKGHKIGEFAERLPAGFTGRERYLALERFSDYAWAHRYPDEGEGEPIPVPSVDEVRAWIDEVRALKADLERRLEAGAGAAGRDEVGNR